MATCAVTGRILDHNGLPWEGIRISVLPEAVPTIVTTSTGVAAITVLPSFTITTSTGIFSISLLQNVRFNVIIREIGINHTILVPSQTSCDLFSLLSLIPVPEPPGPTPPGPAPGPDPGW